MVLKDEIILQFEKKKNQNKRRITGIVFISTRETPHGETRCYLDIFTQRKSKLWETFLRNTPKLTFKSFGTTFAESKTYRLRC